MKRYLFIFSFLLSGLAFSAVEIGNYTGIDEDALPCEIKFEEKYFLEGHPENPINQRFKVLFDQIEFTAHHPILFNHETREVTYHPHYLYAYRGTTDGAILLSVFISDDEGEEGPLSFEVINQNWRTGAKDIFRCFGLVLR